MERPSVQTARQGLVGLTAIAIRGERAFGEPHGRQDIGPQIDRGGGIEVHQDPAPTARQVLQECCPLQGPLVRPDHGGDLITSHHLFERGRVGDRLEVRRQDIVEIRVIAPVDEYAPLAVPGVYEIAADRQAVEDVPRDAAPGDVTGRFFGKVVRNLARPEPPLRRRVQEEAVGDDGERRPEGERGQDRRRRDRGGGAGSDPRDPIRDRIDKRPGVERQHRGAGQGEDRDVAPRPQRQHERGESHQKLEHPHAGEVCQNRQERRGGQRHESDDRRRDRVTRQRRLELDDGARQQAVASQVDQELLERQAQCGGPVRTDETRHGGGRQRQQEIDHPIRVARGGRRARRWKPRRGAATGELDEGRDEPQHDQGRPEDEEPLHVHPGDLEDR